MYTIEMKRETFERVGAWNQKKDTKRIGADWRGLEEGGAVKKSYTERFEAAKAETEAFHDVWQEELVAWRLEKAVRVAASGLPTDSAVRREQGRMPVCSCRFCDGDDGEGSGNRA